jgi:hypothetical protein
MSQKFPSNGGVSTAKSDVCVDVPCFGIIFFSPFYLQTVELGVFTKTTHLHLLLKTNYCCVYSWYFFLSV